jgi:hypothetical protein
MTVTEEKTKEGGKTLVYTDEQVKALVNALIGGSSSNKDATATQTKIIELTPAGARQLLGTIAQDVQYGEKFSKEDIAAFVKAYNKAANEQLDTVIRTAKDRVTSVKGKVDLQKTVSSIVSKEFPTFFDPKGFAEDFIWSKINFGKEATLGAKSLEALQKARSLVNDYGQYLLSDIELQNAAKKIARGQLTEGQFKSQLNQIASVQYPELAESLKANPDSTVRQLRGNKINLIAKLLEKDVNEIQLDNPVLEAIKNLSIPDSIRYVKSLPDREATIEENENARQAATSLARAMGYGV